MLLHEAVCDALSIEFKKQIVYSESADSLEQFAKTRHRCRNGEHV